MGKEIVILGAGYAGILTAKKLEKKIRKAGKSSEIKITLIDQRPFHTMLTELHEVAAWRVEEDSIKINLKQVFAGRKVNVVLDKITEIDYHTKQLQGENGHYHYDYLVMASGSKPAFFGVEGAKENSFTLWSYEDAVKLREHVVEMFRRASCEPSIEKQKALLTFYVVGCGFTGVEMAGELGELVPILCERFDIAPSLVKIVNADILDRVCTVLPEKLSDKIVKRMTKMGIEVALKTNIVEVSQGSITCDKGGKQSTTATHTVIWTAGVESSDISTQAQEIGAAPRGRIQVDENLRAVNDPNVFVGGDNMFFIPTGETQAVPQMVENCEASAELIAHNLAALLLGNEKGLEKYAPKFHGVMVCVGGRYGVAHVGLPGKFFSLPSFFAMFAKHFINIIYFIQVLGWTKVFSYMKHEFFTIRNCRSFVGGHFSNRSPSFFLVPLRIFLGAYWLYEGLVKVSEGWFQKPMLTAFFTGANQFYHNILFGTGTADAVTSATSADGAEAAVQVGEVLINLNILQLVRIVLVKSTEYAFRIQVGLVDLMVSNLIIPNEKLQMVFQGVIVASEIIIGVCLIVGLLTTFNAVYSLMLQVMFLTSTGLYMSSWWMIFAAIAMMFGASRSLSLDYYVMPWLKKGWRKINFVKKWYIYNE